LSFRRKVWARKKHFTCSRTTRKTAYIYAEFTDPKTKRILHRSTGSKDRDEAAVIAAKWLAEGVPTRGRAKKPLAVLFTFGALKAHMEEVYSAGDLGEDQAVELCKALKKWGLVDFGISPAGAGKQDFIKYLYGFYDFENSIYLSDKRARGASVTRNYCIRTQQMIKREWEPVFSGKALAEITRQDLRAFGIGLRKRLAGKTVNNVVLPGRVALRWAYNEKMIPEDVTAGLGGYSGDGKRSGILTDEEMEKLRHTGYWENKKAYTTFMLSSTSAARMGECLALRRQDIGEKVIHIRHGWNIHDGLKTPKNGEERRGVLLPEVKTLLFELLAENPTAESGDQFIFFSDLTPDKPCSDYILTLYFKKAIESAGIDAADRNISFHSLRHAAITAWANKTDIRKAQKAAGHKTLSQTEAYADHVFEKEMAEMSEQAANILNFPAAGKGA
jgi:integrase